MVRPRSGSPRVKHRSYTSDYGSQNGGEPPRVFPSGRGGGPGKAPPGWREAPHRGRKAPYPDRRPAPWQQKSPQARDQGPSPWQPKSQENYLGYASSQSSDAHRHYGDPAPRPSLAQRRPSPHDPSSRPQLHHRQQYDGGPRGFQSRPQTPDQRSHKQAYPPQPPPHRSPFRPPRQEDRPWGRSQSPSGPARPPPRHQHVAQAGERGRGRGRGGRGSGNGCGRQAFWGDRGPDRGNPYPSPRSHHPQARNGEGRCPANSPLRKEREFHSRERWSSSTERDCNERRSRERERMGSNRHGNEPEHWPPPSPSQYRPPPHPPSSLWKAGPPPPGPHSSAASPARRFQTHHTPRGTGRGSSGYRWKFPEMQEQPRQPPPLFKHFQREPSLAPPPRGFGGRGLSLRDKSRLLKNRKFREDSVARFKTLPPPPAPQQQPRMAHRPAPDRSLNPRHQPAGRHVPASAGKLPKRSSSSKKACLDDSPEPVNPVSEGDQDEHKSPQHRRPSSRHSPIPLDKHLPRDLVVVSQWEAGSPENDGDCDDHSTDQGDVEETSDFHSNRITGPQEPPPKATASPQDENNQNKRLVRRPLMSLKTVRPLRKFGQMQAVGATKRSQSIVSKYRLMRQKAPPTPALIIQSPQSTSHRRW